MPFCRMAAVGFFSLSVAAHQPCTIRSASRSSSRKSGSTRASIRRGSVARLTSRCRRTTASCPMKLGSIIAARAKKAPFSPRSNEVTRDRAISLTISAIISSSASSSGFMPPEIGQRRGKRKAPPMKAGPVGSMCLACPLPSLECRLRQRLREIEVVAGSIGGRPPTSSLKTPNARAWFRENVISARKSAAGEGGTGAA